MIGAGGPVILHDGGGWAGGPVILHDGGGWAGCCETGENCDGGCGSGVFTVIWGLGAGVMVSPQLAQKR